MNNLPRKYTLVLLLLCCESNLSDESKPETILFSGGLIHIFTELNIFIACLNGSIYDLLVSSGD